VTGRNCLCIKTKRSLKYLRQAQRGAPGLLGIFANTARSFTKGIRGAAALTVASIT
jgi:hypothetical protein